MYRISAVCTGNICRSPMAQFCLTRAFRDAGLETRVRVTSAGVSAWEAGRPMDDRARAELLKHGFQAQELAPFRAHAFEAGEFAAHDLILALDYGHLAELQERAPAAADRRKIRLLRSFDPAAADLAPEQLGIEDPWYGDMADFDSSYTLISAAVPGVVRHVAAALDAASGGTR